MPDYRKYTLLHGHVGQENAYLIEDYPYGRLRCQKKMWIDKAKPKMGVRVGEQTSNPKRGNDWNNKPKFSVYQGFGVLYIDHTDNDHVKWYGIGQYPSMSAIADFRATGLPLQFTENEGVEFDTFMNYVRKFNGKSYDQWMEMEKRILDNASSASSRDELYQLVNKVHDETGIEPLYRNHFDSVCKALMTEGKLSY